MGKLSSITPLDGFPTVDSLSISLVCVKLFFLIVLITDSEFNFCLYYIVAQSLGLPFLEPFIDQVKNANTSSRDFSKGVNFAVGGATALDVSFLEKYGIFNPLTNISLSTQLDWFKEYFTIFCQANSGNSI